MESDILSIIQKQQQQIDALIKYNEGKAKLEEEEEEIIIPKTPLQNPSTRNYYEWNMLLASWTFYIAGSLALILSGIITEQYYFLIGDAIMFSVGIGLVIIYALEWTWMVYVLMIFLVGLIFKSAWLIIVDFQYIINCKGNHHCNGSTKFFFYQTYYAFSALTLAYSFWLIRVCLRIVNTTIPANVNIPLYYKNRTD